LCNRPHLPADPGSQDFATLLLSKARAREVTKSDESHNVEDKLVLIKHRVDDDGDKRREESTRAYFGDKYEQRAGLENGAVKYVSISITPDRGNKN